MCLLIAKHKQGQIAETALETAWESNPHGAGFAVPDGSGAVHICKFLTFEEFIKAYREQDVKNRQALIHFRFATHGVRTERNVHPFRVRRDVAFAHNGILSAMPGDKKLSDTGVFCRDIIKPVSGGLFGSSRSEEAVRALLDAYARAESSKFALLTGDGRFVISNEVAGHWLKGVWYSNYSYDDWGDMYGYGSRKYTTGYGYSKNRAKSENIGQAGSGGSTRSLRPRQSGDNESLSMGGNVWHIGQCVCCFDTDYVRADVGMCADCVRDFEDQVTP